jgi:hypothetical protein
MNEIKYVGKCPTCVRGIERGDDVVERGGVVYHEECAPPELAAAESAVVPVVKVPSLPELQALVKSGGKKKMGKQDELLAKLLEAVGHLTDEVAELKARPTLVAPPAARKKSEKGQPRPTVYYVLKGFPTEKRPPQCLRVMRALAQAAPEGGKMTEVEVWNALMGPGNKLGPWNYQQSPFYIFKYYRADMIDAGYVVGPFDV